MNEPLLELNHVIKLFPLGGFLKRRQLMAVDDVSFQMPSEESTIVTLAGESGSGKTTIGRLILKLITPSAGEIKYRGKNIFGISRRESYAYLREVQAVFQDPYGTLNPFYKVDHVLITPIKQFKLMSSLNEARKMMEEALETVGLAPKEILGKYPHQLSGGEAQRVLIARALLTNPKLLVADEPVSMIDASVRAGLLNLLLELKDNFSTSILFVTHDLSVARYISDRIILLNLGRIVERGKTEEVMNNPLHPYTQLLMKSIPVPNPNKRWQEDITISDVSQDSSGRDGCVFIDKCPDASEACSKIRPNMVSVNKDHEVACHLYDSPKG